MTTETTDSETDRGADERGPGNGSGSGSGAGTDRDAERRADDPAPTCAYCGQSFERERYLALHRGLRHRDRLSGDELTAFEDALETEERELRRFRLKALIALVLLYFGLLMAYAAFS